MTTLTITVTYDETKVGPERVIYQVSSVAQSLLDLHMDIEGTYNHAGLKIDLAIKKTKP